MLKRKVYQELLKWKENTEGKALCIIGARQIGKTTLIREFGKNEYEHFAEINFVTDEKAADIFNDKLTAEAIITNLTAYLQTPLEPGKTLGIVGESGSGKSVTSYSIMQILAETGKITGGEVLYRGEDISKWNEKQMQKFRGEKCSIIFQDPMTSLNPVFTIGNQLMEAILLHTDKDKKQARERAIEMLTLVGVNEPESRLKQYPHELSGGMRQRVMIAMALVCEPDILIADEPTTALDVTIQAQILELMQDLQKKLGMAIIMVTHDLGVIASMCDEIIVMYGGRVCERGTADAIFYHPAHEYTKGLLRSIPKADNMNEKLIPIGGTPINLLQMPEGCAFCPRCESAMKICLKQQPAEFRVGEDHLASCWMNVKEIYEAQEGGSNEQ